MVKGILLNYNNTTDSLHCCRPPSVVELLNTTHNNNTTDSRLRHLALAAGLHAVAELLDLERHLEEVVFVVDEPRRLL